jgi:hypothetical protein
MDDLLKKLNTLVSAQVNDLAAKIPSFGGKPDVSRQVTELRERVNTAMAHEEQLRSTVLTLRDEIVNLDTQVNNALQNGQEPIARALLDQMQRLEKRLAFAEADLRQHQNAAADLIGRVSALEAAVQNASSATAPAISQAKTPAAPPVQESGSAPTGAGSIGALMDAALGNADEVKKSVVPTKSTNTPKSDEKEATTPKTEKSEGQAQNSHPSETPAEGAIPKPWAVPSGNVVSGGETPAAKPQQQPKQKRKPKNDDVTEADEDDATEKPYTAKDLARDAREEAEEQLERTNQGVESVGGMLRDIQARTKSRMESLDKMLREGGLLDNPADEAKTAVDKTKKEKDLEDRLKRLSKPD